jgi:shikimate kinase
MGMTDKVWDAFTTVLKMNDKVVSMSGVIKEQQGKIEHLTERVIKLEVTLELLMRANEHKKLN